MDRRNFVKQTGVVLAAASSLGSLAACSGQSRPFVGAAGIGMCDWNLGPMCDPEQIARAAEADLDGIQVSLGRNPEEMVLRDPAVRASYIELGRQHGITFHSVALGLFNTYPLAEEPRAAVWLVDAIEAAVALGAGNVLMAFFGRGDLRFRDADGEFVNESDSGYASYRLDEAKVTSVVETLEQVVPRARDAGVVLGLENTISAAQNLEIIERVGSEWLQVYYDLGNSTGYGYDVPGEIRMLGSDRICEVHLKDWRTPLLGRAEGMVDMPAAAAALSDIGYDKWLVLETSGREDHFLEDTRRNVAWARQTFQSV
ncbi:MAG: sugar phosphate isomerase/epimerase family protein [Gemmatimonadales bacterium]|jgi:sugar phosphate isomerase/epimerase